MDNLKQQKIKIDEYKSFTKPYDYFAAGIKLKVYPNVYTGGKDSEILSETMKINHGDDVLDLCTGTGIVALKAKQLGANKVVGTDLNPDAIKCARNNAKILNMANIEFIEGNLFANLNNKFDVITMNPPYTNHKAKDKTEICFWDNGNSTTVGLFKNFRKYLKPNGRAYLAWSNFAPQDLLDKLALKNNVNLKLLAKKHGKSDIIFYVYELVPTNLKNLLIYAQ